LVNSTIIVHGGAGDWPKSKQAIGLSGVRQAATRGFRLLQQGESSIQAVEAAVMEMEDNPVFNAGTGSTFNSVGNVEGDAAIMVWEASQGRGGRSSSAYKEPDMSGETRNGEN